MKLLMFGLDGGVGELKILKMEIFNVVINDHE
jgi:hypothetical protein